VTGADGHDWRADWSFWSIGRGGDRIDDEFDAVVPGVTSDRSDGIDKARR
jgi:hypothetical protein